MAADGSIILDTSIDTSGITKDAKKIKPEVERATKSTKDLGNEFEQVGKKGKQSFKEIDDGLNNLQSALGDLASTIGLSFGLDSLIDFGQKAIGLASDIQEVQNVVDTSFGDMAGQVEAFAQTSIDSFGMSELTAKQTAGRFMSMSTALGLAQAQAADMALTVTGLTGDMASFYNVSQDVASTALASIWTGETESLKRFGIVMTQTNLEAYALSQGINKTWNEMTQAEQVQLRYNYVMEQTALAQGDFEKTQDSWANQQRILKESTDALAASIGEGLMESLTPLQGIIVDIVKSLMEFQESTGLLDDFFMVLIGGVTGLIALKAASVIQTVADAVMQMGSAAMLANLQGDLAAISIGALVAVIAQLAGSWDSMTGGEKVVAMLAAVTTAALVAAVAVGAFQSALTLGIAAAAIVAGIAVIMATINSAQSRMQTEAAKFQNLQSTSYAIAGTKPLTSQQLASRNVPRLATGAVIPANGEFLAVLGDQKNGRNLEAPESLIRQIVREESGGNGSLSGVLTIRPAPGLTRYLSYELEAEQSRAGTPLVEGERR